MHKIIIIASLLFSSLVTLATSNQHHLTYVPCREDNAKYSLRSAELQLILKADQADRKKSALPIDIQERDRKRRQRVGAIFGEGCFKYPRDYIAAALVFQHGDMPDHFFQTYLWAKQAVDLGDTSNQSLVAAGVDRYLVSTGRKQLFATQYYLPSTNPHACWCLYKTEATFPDELRIKYTTMSYQQSLERLKQLNSNSSHCPVAECAENLEKSPQGTIPGLW